MEELNFLSLKWEAVSTLLPSCDAVLSKLAAGSSTLTQPPVLQDFDAYDIMDKASTRLFTVKIEK